MSFNFKDKAKNLANMNIYMLAKTVSMFEWENLPETIPYRELEKMLQRNGFAFVTEHTDGNLYAFYGGLGGVPDVYGNPTEINISNPALNISKTFKLDEGVLIINDDFKMGLIPLFDRYNTFLVENDINMMVYGYNTRTQKLMSASDDKTKASAESVIKKSIDGEIAVIGESAIFEGIKVHTGVNNSGVSITSLTEFTQYIKASLYNEIGLSANFNMKRERLTQGETEQGDDALFPFVFNMLKCRTKAVEQLNKMFNLNIGVDFGSVWAKGSKEVIDDEINHSDKNVNQEIDNNNEQNSAENNVGEEKIELESIINNPESTQEDIDTAKELLAELEQ